MPKTSYALTWFAAVAIAAQIACVSSPPPAAMKKGRPGPVREFLNVGDQPNGYTHTVMTSPGRMVFVSGAAGAGPDGEMPTDFAVQADNTFKSLGERLALAGADFDDVVKVTYFMGDAADLSVLREVRANYLNMDNPPAASAIPVNFKGPMMLEVEAIAVLHP